MAELPGKDLAQDLLKKSEAEKRSTPMEAVIKAAKAGKLTEDSKFRLIARLWTLERLFYYVYGGWGQGLEVGDFPPSVKYLFARQIVDESGHEMIYTDVMLNKGWVKSQTDAFHHPYCQFAMDSVLAVYLFSLRNMATYPHPIRIAGLNLGAKVLELGWMEPLAEALDDKEVAAAFTSQFVENRSHILMGRRIVEENVSTPFQKELCQWASRVTKRDYAQYLKEVSDFVLGGPIATKAEVTALGVTD